MRLRQLRPVRQRQEPQAQAFDRSENDQPAAIERPAPSTAADLGLSRAVARAATPPRGKGRKEAAPTAGTPKYRDPKTGATWTGHGRPPAWLAAAGNRDRFLIDAPAVPGEPGAASG